MTWFCQARRAFISPTTGRIVLIEDVVVAGAWLDEQGEVTIWEGWWRP